MHFPTQANIHLHSSARIEFIPGTDPRYPKIQIWKDFLHKQVVEGLGYVPGVCWNFLGFWIPSSNFETIVCWNVANMWLTCLAFFNFYAWGGEDQRKQTVLESLSKLCQATTSPPKKATFFRRAFLYYSYNVVVSTNSACFHHLPAKPQPVNFSKFLKFSNRKWHRLPFWQSGVHHG